METASNTGATLKSISQPAAAGSQAARKAPRLDLASWVAIAAFVAYIGVGILA